MSGNLFYLIIFGAIGLSIWISTQQFILGIIAVDYALATFWNFVPEVSYPYLALGNIFMFAIAYLWNPLAPHKTN